MKIKKTMFAIIVLLSGTSLALANNSEQIASEDLYKFGHFNLGAKIGSNCEITMSNLRKLCSSCDSQGIGLEIRDGRSFVRVHIPAVVEMTEVKSRDDARILISYTELSNTGGSYWGIGERKLRTSSSIIYSKEFEKIISLDVYTEIESRWGRWSKDKTRSIHCQ